MGKGELSRRTCLPTDQQWQNWRTGNATQSGPCVGGVYGSLVGGVK